MAVIGKGTFGTVLLVQYEEKAHALKIMKKGEIIKKKHMEHIQMEK
jgi:serine/threonine protein kinase